MRGNLSEGVRNSRKSFADQRATVTKCFKDYGKEAGVLAHAAFEVLEFGFLTFACGTASVLLSLLYVRRASRIDVTDIKHDVFAGTRNDREVSALLDPGGGR